MDGKRLKKLRLERKLTQEELGKIIHVSKVSISGYENGNRTPDTDTLQKLADFFGVTTDYLLGRDKIKDKTKDQDTIQSEDEIRIFEELKKYPLLFHDLTSNPEGIIKELNMLYKVKKILKEDGEEENKDGFGELED